LKKLFSHLRESVNPSGIEIILADGNSSDDSVGIAALAGAQVVDCSKASRPFQMNMAAKKAKADILYFVHADTLPPKDFLNQVLAAIASGAEFGSFRFRFDSDRAALRFNSWCTRIPIMMFRGGDQSLFITRKLFDRLGGYDEKYLVMEDYDIIRRGKKFSRFHILSDDVIVSSRKYTENSYPRVNLSNFFIFCLYYLGVSPLRLKILYGRLIKHPKWKNEPASREPDMELQAKNVN